MREGDLVELSKFANTVALGTTEFATISAIAEKLFAHLNTEDARAKIALANKPGASSAAVQAVFRDYALSLGFVDESKGLFQGYETSALRPDYYLKVGETGILLEVERGKTTINNMDLMDFWKCHLCRHAHYLFLLVPKALRQNQSMKARNEYAYVVRRLGTFFSEGNYTNVRGLFVFGY